MFLETVYFIVQNVPLMQFEMQYLGINIVGSMNCSFIKERILKIKIKLEEALQMNWPTKVLQTNYRYEN